MNGRFDLVGVADVAMGRDAHELQPCANREALVEAKEGGVSKGRWSLPMPFSWVPREILNKSGIKNPKEEGFFAGRQQVPSDLEGRSGSFLNEDSSCRGELKNLVGRCLDATIESGSFILNYVGSVSSGLDD
ncbi:unnamed protein product [Sphagnum troendelagicum]|uniref:Uncharacterized protein n=1 Tax=Sphagnum troendelagicum TaxID=128251 RepID=A0ABP0UJ25_9BRYO